MATVPATRTFVDGVFLSSDPNTYIRDPLNFLLNKPVAELRQTVLQSLPSGAWTSITFTTEDIDTDVSGTGGHSNSVNTSRYTAVYPGWYLCSGGVGYVATATAQRGTRWTVNGTAVNGSATFVPTTAAFDVLIASRTKRIFLNVGDYVEMQAWQDTGGLLNTNVSAENQSHMSIGWERNA